MSNQKLGKEIQFWGRKIWGFLQKKFWTKDRVAFMACLGIALVAWVLNKLSGAFIKTETIALNYTLPQGKVFSNPPPIKVSAVLRGRGWQLIFNKPRAIFINLNAEDSIQVFPLRTLVAQVFENEVDIISLSREQVNLVVAPSFTVTVPLIAQTDANFALGYNLSEIQLIPSTLEVSGPESVVRKLAGIKTDTIRLEKLGGKQTFEITPVPHPLFQYNVQTVQAQVLAEQYTEKSLFVPITLKNSPAKMKIFPNRIRIDCLVALSRYGQVSAQNFLAEVDLTGISQKSTSNVLGIHVVAPDFIRNVRFSPKTIEFYFQR
jgi:hypothetical protein